jgi:hypothetical protein
MTAPRIHTRRMREQANAAPQEDGAIRHQSIYTRSK